MRLSHWLGLAAVIVLASRAPAQGIETEVAAVVSQWQNPPTATDSLEALVVRSAAIRDARVLAALQAAALQSSYTSQVRIGALRAAFTFAAGRPSALPSSTELSGDSLELAGSVTGIVPQLGPQSVTTTTLTSLLSAMQSIASGDPNPDIRAAAARVSHVTGVAIAAKPQLTYTCGRKFRLRNTADLTTVVDYTVAGTSETGQVTVAARSAGQAYADTFFSTNNYGSVTVYLPSGETIGSASNARTACP
jgi:hypothetical protein